MSSIYVSIVDKLRPNGELDDSWYKNSGNVLKFGKANDVEKRHKKGDKILYELEFACEADALYAEQKILEALRKDYEPYASKKEHFIVEVSERDRFILVVSKMAHKIRKALNEVVEKMASDDAKKEAEFYASWYSRLVQKYTRMAAEVLSDNTKKEVESALSYYRAEAWKWARKTAEAK